MSYKKNHKNLKRNSVENLYNEVGLEVEGLYEFLGRFRCVYAGSETVRCIQDSSVGKSIIRGNSNFALGAGTKLKLSKHDCFILLGHNLQYCKPNSRTNRDDGCIADAVKTHLKNETYNKEGLYEYHEHCQNLYDKHMRKCESGSIHTIKNIHMSKNQMTRQKNNEKTMKIVKDFLYEKNQNENINIKIQLQFMKNREAPLVYVTEKFPESNPLIKGRLYILYNQNIGWINVNNMSLEEIHNQFKLKARTDPNLKQGKNNE